MERTQREVVCGRMWDHEGHTWYSNEGKWCPGVVAAPEGFGTEAIEPRTDAGNAGTAARLTSAAPPLGEAVQATPKAPEGAEVRRRLTDAQPEPADRRSPDDLLAEVERRIQAVLDSTEWDGWEGRHRLAPRLRDALRDLRAADAEGSGR